MKKILLTGATGFIGKNIYELLQHEYYIISPSHTDLNLENPEQVFDFFAKHRVDFVIHSAFLGGSGGIYFPDSCEKNIRMVVNILHHRKSFKKFIYISSGAEYDKRIPLHKVKETNIEESIPVDQYGFTKYICSKYVTSFPNVIVFRPFGIFGKYEDYSRRFISQTMCRIILGLPIVINQNVKYDYLYISDFVKILKNFLDAYEAYNVYNIGSGKSIDLITIAKKIIAVSGKKADIIIRTQNLNNEYTPSIARLRKELKNFQFTSYEKAFSELYAWYSKNKHLIRRDLLI